MASKISETPGVASAAPHLAVPASLLIGDNPLEAPEVRSLKVFGVDPESAALATGFELAEGRFPEKGAEMTLDEGAAESAGLALGDEVVVGTQEGPAKLTVVGTLRMPGVSFGGAALGMIKLPYAQKLFDKPGAISAVSIEAEDEGAVAAELGEGSGSSNPRPGPRRPTPSSRASTWPCSSSPAPHSSSGRFSSSTPSP